MRNNFVILFQGRSGSTFLTESLSSHPNINVCGETLAALCESGADAQTQWAKNFFVRQMPTECLSAGFKTKLSDVLDQPAITAVLRSANCRVVHLNRSNMVKQVVSWFRAETLFDRTAKWNAYDPAHVVTPIFISIDLFIDRLQMLEEGKRDLEQYVLDLQLPVCAVQYEKLYAQPSLEFERVQDFLGVSKFSLQARCIKHTDDNLQHAVQNYSEVRAALAGTTYEAMFD